MRVVFDANVLVSGLNSRTSGSPSILVTMWYEGAFDVALSEHIVAKVGDAWRKPYYQAFFMEEDILETLQRISTLARMVSPVEDIHGIAADDEDDLVLATAVAANADYLVSGDKYLQRLGEFRGIRIVSPREFLDMMLSLP